MKRNTMFFVRTNFHDFAERFDKRELMNRHVLVRFTDFHSRSDITLKHPKMFKKRNAQLKSEIENDLFRNEVSHFRDRVGEPVDLEFSVPSQSKVPRTLNMSGLLTQSGA